ncbi:hypothetical protein BDFB_002299 [Asbolus verrucosus]|uniref:Uncharacterized protein n=1 Tax=Asbolus verrucosus TaxID=1661398 RepID=A0A482WA97_ASBVE|nr:hypothetical protein BDFB_002299 [Asbolus verrucosus]
MICLTEQKAFITENYFRNGCKIDGEWSYSLQDCREEFRAFQIL